MEKHLIIETFVANFIQKDKRERCFLELTNPKKRNKFTDRLNHKWESVIEMRLLTKIEKGQDYADRIKELSKFKDNELCYVISNYNEFDDKLLPLMKFLTKFTQEVLLQY